MSTIHYKAVLSTRKKCSFQMVGTGTPLTALFAFATHNLNISQDPSTIHTARRGAAEGSDGCEAMPRMEWNAQLSCINTGRDDNENCRPTRGCSRRQIKITLQWYFLAEHGHSGSLAV